MRGPRACPITSLKYKPLRGPHAWKLHLRGFWFILTIHNYCDVPDEEYPRSNKLEDITKERISSKLKAIRKNYKKAVDCGKRSGGGRVVMTFYDLCHDIWAGAPSTNSIEGIVRDNLYQQTIS